MSILQSTYDDNVSPGLPGMVANSETSVIISRTVEVGNLPFGAPAIQGTDDHAIAPPVDAASAVIGLTKRDTTLGAEVEHYRPEATAALVKQGVVWVVTGGAVNRRGAVYYDIAANRYRGAAAAGRVLVPNASYEDTATAAEQAVRVRMAPTP